MANVSGSMSIAGRASLLTMSALPTSRVGVTATSRRRSPSDDTSPASRAAGATKVTAWSAPSAPTSVGRISTGWGVGIDALGSPSAPHTSAPPLMTTCGRIPKNRGSQSTRSASLPGSTEPTSWAIPCAIAGLIVYFAT